MQQWVNRWRTVLRQWAEVEVEMAKEYDLGTSDIFSMSWRRFRVLFGGVFSWNDGSTKEPELPTEYEPGKGILASQVDWSSGEQIKVPDLLSQIPGEKIKVGKPE